MKNILLILLLILISCDSQSQNKIDLSPKNISISSKDNETGWIRIKLNNPNKWGFISQDSLIVIPFEYDFLNPFENGLAYAKNKGKEFFITKKNLKLEGDFDAVNIFSEGFASAKSNNKWGFIDGKGKFVISPQYDMVDYFRPSGLCAVQKNGKSGFIDKNGIEIIPIIYSSVNQQMLDENVIVQKNGKWAVFDNKGKQLSDFIYDKIHRTDAISFSKNIFDRTSSTYFGNDAALAERNGKFEFISRNATSAFSNNKFDSATVFDAFKNAIVKRNGKYGMIKPNGEFKVPLIYDFIEPYDTHHGSYSEYYNARKGKVFSIYNKNLKKIGATYEAVYNDFSINNPTLIFKDLNNKYGMVDSDGNILITFEYDKLSEIEKTQFFHASKGELYGVINQQNKIQIPFAYKILFPLYDKFDDEEKLNRHLFIGDGSLIDINNKVLLKGYDFIDPIYYNHDKLIVSKNKKFGVVDTNGKTIVPVDYDKISNWVEYGPEKRHIITKNKKYGMLDFETFTLKIPLIYEFVFISRYHVFVRKENKYGIIDLNNRIICPLVFDKITPSSGFGLGFNDDKIYAKKGGKFYEISIKGEILKNISNKEFTKEINLWNK